MYADIKFEPVIGSNGKPLAFDYTNFEFADRFCPLIRFAFAINGWDQDRVRKFWHDMTNSPEDPTPSRCLLSWTIGRAPLRSSRPLQRSSGPRTRA
jgi:hypothetical protein